MDTIKPVVIGHTRETVHLRIAVTILLVLVAYRMVIDFSPQLKFFFELHTQLPVLHALTNFLFFWLLALLWIAYRRWHEAVVRRRELETIFTSINPDVLLVADGEDRITMCTVVVADMFGYQPGELLGKRTDFLYSDPVEVGQKRETAVYPKAKSSCIGYATGRKKDGSPLALEIIVSRLVSSSGKVILLRDIAAWKDAESSLIESERRYRSLVENAPVGVLLVDVDGRITAVNQPMLRMMGAPSTRDLVGSGVMGPDSPVGVVIASAVRRCMDLRVPVFLEELCTSQWRRELRLEIHLAPLQDAENRPIGVQGVFADITESHRLREEFLQAQKMEAIGHLAGGIAHDFNNLLTIITGYTDLLKRSLSPGDTANAIVDEILNAGNRAGDLTRQLLAFARRQKIQPRVVNVNQVIMGMDGIMRRLIGAHIELVFLPADDLWAVCADAAQIQQCIMNLAVNARDAMIEGGKIVIRTANMTCDEAQNSRYDRIEAGRYVMISVSDTGTGMSDHVLSHIFEPFFSTKGPQAGSGLGLATVYGIVKQSHGYVSVHSEEGKGSKLDLYFPRVEGKPEDALAADVDTMRLRGSETILVVEDERSVREFAAAILENFGYNVLKAQNGEDAMRVAKQFEGKIDLLLTDVVMPKMGGYELASMLPGFIKGLKVLFVSGYASLDLPHQATIDPQHGYLQKPFTGITLTKKVREILDA